MYLDTLEEEENGLVWMSALLGAYGWRTLFSLHGFVDE
jgi:hypothetical protein